MDEADSSARSEIVYTAADSRFDVVVDGISDLDLKSLWLLLDHLPIDAGPLAHFLGAFAPALLEAWHVSEGGYRTPAMKAKLRAFGPYTRLAERITSNFTLDLEGKTYYSDTAILRNDYGAVASFLSRSTAGSDSALASVSPSSNDSVASWASATLPLLTLWLMRPFKLGDSFGQEDLFLSFLRCTIACEVIPIPLFFDLSMRPALAAFGTEETLEPIAQRLAAKRESMALAERLARGMLPPSIQ